MTQTHEQLARKHGVSVSAVETLARAIAVGHGTIAQFNHPELGGMGQWMPGMVMVGDMFNTALKAKVDQLCSELVAVYQANPAAYQSTMASPEQWWSDELGQPATSGIQNESAYAYFPAHNRLLIKRNETIITYDTTGHTITGVSQQQANTIKTLVFQTTRGPITEHELDRI